MFNLERSFNESGDHVLVQENLCCELNCMARVHSISKMSIRNEFQSLSRMEKNQRLLNYIHHFADPTKRLYHYVLYFVILWRHIRGFSKNSLLPIYAGDNTMGMGRWCLLPHIWRSHDGRYTKYLFLLFLAAVSSYIGGSVHRSVGPSVCPPVKKCQKLE